jgi:hypothetical protein
LHQVHHRNKNFKVVLLLDSLAHARDLSELFFRDVIQEVWGVICLRKSANRLLYKVTTVCVHRSVTLVDAVAFCFKKARRIIETLFVFLGILLIPFLRFSMGVARSCGEVASELWSLDLEHLVRIIGPVGKVGVLRNFERLVLLAWLVQQVKYGFLAF